MHTFLMWSDEELWDILEADRSQREHLLTNQSPPSRDDIEWAKTEDTKNRIKMLNQAKLEAGEDPRAVQLSNCPIPEPWNVIIRR